MSKKPIADLIAAAEIALAAAADPDAPPASRALRLRLLYRRGSELSARTAELVRWLDDRWEDDGEEAWLENIRKYERACRCLRELDAWLDAHKEAA